MHPRVLPDPSLTPLAFVCLPMGFSIYFGFPTYSTLHYGWLAPIAPSLSTFPHPVSHNL